VLITTVDLFYKIPSLNFQHGVKVSLFTIINIIVDTTAFHNDVTYRRVYLAKARKARNSSLEKALISIGTIHAGLTLLKLLPRALPVLT
jgi:hypothetical protein